MKYQRYGYVEPKPFTPGQRYRSRLEMEAKVPGYRDISRELRAVSEEIGLQRMSTPDRTPPPICTLRNSPIGYTTQAFSGKLYSHDFSWRNSRFTNARREMVNPNMKHVYKYFGTQV